MKCKAHFLWFLYILKDRCEDEEAADICNNLNEDSYDRICQFVSNLNNYVKLTWYIFEVKTDSPLKILHENGYYKYGDTSLFTQTEFDKISFINLIECYMWANLDRRIPTDLLVKKVGKVKIFASKDPETILCSWINTCCYTCTKLRQIQSISHDFIGSNHFRALLYSYIKDESLLKFANPQTNAYFSLNTCASYGFHKYFEPEEYRQSPLVIMCYLVDMIKFLDELKPRPAPRPVSQLDVQKINKNIAETKKEVESIKVRCGALANDISVITARILKMKRASSTLCTVRNRMTPGHNEDSAINGLPILNVNLDAEPRPKSALRVKWDIPDEIMSSHRSSVESGQPQESPQSAD